MRSFSTSFLASLGSVLVSFLSIQTHASLQFDAPKKPKSLIKDIDLYGSKSIGVNDIKRIWGRDLNSCLTMYLQANYEQYFRCKTNLISQIQSRYHFAFLDLSLIGYFQKDQQLVYATVDVVEPKDEKIRMAFQKRPSQTFADPDALLRSWEEYQKLGFSLLGKQEIKGNALDCQALHCIFGHSHPELKPFARIFTEGVAQNKEKLELIFLYDKSDAHRADAVFLLAYQKDGQGLLNLLSKRIFDESALVRNNIMRVIVFLTLFHPELDLPIDEVIKVLNFPETSDRNKAGYVLAAVVKNPMLLQKYKKRILAQALPNLLSMLRLSQPNNHDPAYQILRGISGEAYAERDYLRWEAWANLQKTD